MDKISGLSGKDPVWRQGSGLLPGLGSLRKGEKVKGVNGAKEGREISREVIMKTR